MDPSQPALQLHLMFIIPLSGKQPLLTLPLFPDALILPLPVEPIGELLSSEPVFLFFLGGQLLHLQHTAKLAAIRAPG